MTEVEQSNSIVGTDLQLAYSLERNSLQERRILELTQELRAAQERIRAAEARAERAERLLGEAQGASTGKTEAP